MMKPISLSNDITIDVPIILAPMSGVTDLPYRNVVSTYGAGLVVSEMIASRAMIIETRQSMQKCQITSEGLTSVQLAGCDPEIMGEAAKLNEERGAKIIDINFGCPAKQVTGGDAGSALMKNLQKAEAIMQAVVSAVKVPVTVKMRTGWDDKTRNAPKLAEMAEKAGVKMLTVHGRTRCQMYTGKADWQFINEVKKSVSIPVIANGDINNIEDALQAMEISKADGVMVGRGCYGRPWLIKQITHYIKTGKKLPDPPYQEQLNTIVKHFDEMIKFYGEQVGVKMSRKHIGWYSSGTPNSAIFRQEINKMTDPTLIKERISEFYSALPENVDC